MDKQPVQYIQGRGCNVGPAGLFRDGDGLTMHATRAMAVAFAKQWNWPARYVCRVHNALFGGYAVAQFRTDTIVFLCDDGTTSEVPFIDRRRQPLAIE